MAPHLSEIYERFGARPDWMNQAACAGEPPEVFFPEDEESAGLAKEVCGTCPVRLDCLDFALSRMRDATDVGIWGGTTEKERRAIRRKVRRARELERRAARLAEGVTPVT